MERCGGGGLLPLPAPPALLLPQPPLPLLLLRNHPPVVVLRATRTGTRRLLRHGGRTPNACWCQQWRRRAALTLQCWPIACKNMKRPSGSTCSTYSVWLASCGWAGGCGELGRWGATGRQRCHEAGQRPGEARGPAAASPPAPAAAGRAGECPGCAPAPRSRSGWCGCPATTRFPRRSGAASSTRPPAAAATRRARRRPARARARRLPPSAGGGARLRAGRRRPSAHGDDLVSCRWQCPPPRLPLHPPMQNSGLICSCRPGQGQQRQCSSNTSPNSTWRGCSACCPCAACACAACCCCCGCGCPVWCAAAGAPAVECELWAGCGCGAALPAAPPCVAAAAGCPCCCCCCRCWLAVIPTCSPLKRYATTSLEMGWKAIRKWPHGVKQHSTVLGGGATPGTAVSGTRFSYSRLLCGVCVPWQWAGRRCLICSTAAAAAAAAAAATTAGGRRLTTAPGGAPWHSRSARRRARLWAGIKRHVAPPQRAANYLCLSTWAATTVGVAR